MREVAETGKVTGPEPAEDARAPRLVPLVPALVVAAAVGLFATVPGWGQSGALFLEPAAGAPVPRAGGAGCAIEPHDGGWESGVGFQPTQNAVNFAQRFELPSAGAGSEWYLDDVCLTLSRTGSPGPSTFNFVVFLDQAGQPGDAIAFKTTTAEIAAFPGTTLCAGDFALRLGAWDAIHVGVSWNPQQSNVFLMMDESPSTPAQTVSVRSSSTGPSVLQGWSPATTIRPDIKAAGVGITLFASTPDWVTTELGALAGPYQRDLLGGVGLADGHRYIAGAIYQDRQPPQLHTFGLITGPSGRGGLTGGLSHRVDESDLPFDRAFSLGGVLRHPTSSKKYWIPAVSSDLDVWIAETEWRVGEHAPGDVAWRRALAAAADTFSSVDGINLGSERHLYLFNVTKFDYELYRESNLDWSWEKIKSYDGGQVLSAGFGALDGQIVGLDPALGFKPSVCAFYSLRTTQTTFDYMAACGDWTPVAVLEDLPFTPGFGRDVYVTPVVPFQAKQVGALVESARLPDQEWAPRFHVTFQRHDGGIVSGCFDLEPDRLVTSVTWQVLAQGKNGRSSLLGADVGPDQRFEVSYLDPSGDFWSRKGFAVGPGCSYRQIEEEPEYVPATLGRPIVPESREDYDLAELILGLTRHGYGHLLERNAWQGAIFQGLLPQGAKAPPTPAGWGESAGAAASLLEPRAATVGPLALAERLVPRPCLSGDGAHCLGDGRFEVSVDWRANGEDGIGRRVDLTDDSGLFYFFNPTNLELITKVLDACGTAFDSYWVFSAGLTDVQYVLEVFDSQTGLRRHYVNPRQTAALPVLDTAAFETCAAAASGRVGAEESVALPGWALDALAARRHDHQARGAAADHVVATPAVSPRADDCTPGPTTLCLADGRFEVEVEWATEDASSGDGRAIPLTADTGAFWFFDAANVEVLIKVLDACSTAFDSFWVFAAGLTNVEVRLTVTDTQTDQVKVYDNPLNRPFQPIQDTDAFATCP